MKLEKQRFWVIVESNAISNVLVCISLLFIISTVLLVPHSVYAQELELEEDVNDALVHKNHQDVARSNGGLNGLVATGIDPKPSGSICHFRVEGDYVHTSMGDASGHGWWVNTDCEATQAVVTIRLQQSINGNWVYVGLPGQKTVYSGGGAANRAAT